ncbi:hypothetical protein [Streptomyces sp. NPDC048659]|uniref:hypothetical protein n=1 Tax=Streptomyces sp. NPDC048659 TaxID=3155489 RepID=UPI003429F3F5
MSQPTHPTPPTPNRRSLLGAALALPAALTVGGLAAAPPATAAPEAAATPQAPTAPEAPATPVPSAAVEAGEWTDLALEPGITATAGAPPQVRLLTLAGTVFLQARGQVTGSYTADMKIATLPPGFARPTWYVRGVAARNNSQGINACRFEINPAGAVTVYGGNAGNPVTWVQFDSVQTIWR